jgi:hypothetical protein
LSTHVSAAVRSKLHLLYSPFRLRGIQKIIFTADIPGSVTVHSWGSYRYEKEPVSAVPPFLQTEEEDSFEMLTRAK